ncbi:MAG TPA: lytic murein transglycosylase B [Caldimonas sp.]|nr:lytic murein transglycosylase B [Caldimonas sp.]
MIDPGRRRTFLAAAALLATTAAPALAAKRKARRPRAAVATDDAPDVVTYGGRDDVMQFADAVALRQGLEPAAVRAALAQARFMPAVTRYIMPPPQGAAKNWAAYRARFVEPIRIGAGVSFWRDNEAWLRLAEERYGVPPEIVVGIVGVESIYGRHMGSFRVIDSLATLSFDFPAGRSDRSEFFRGELESWFVLCNNQAIDPLDWQGSYAGAIGMAQFMPSSFNRFAVDLDGDGHVDLRRSAADVIGSVAHYLAQSGWRHGLAVRYPVVPPLDAANLATLRAPDILPTFTAGQMSALGASLPESAAATDSALALVELQNGADDPTFVAGTTNFYAITRYNWSSYYAMAVTDLGEAVRDAVEGARS